MIALKKKTLLNITWLLWFIACLSRLRWFIVTACIIGVVVNIWFMSKEEKKEWRWYWVRIAFFSLVVVGNLLFVIMK